MPLCEETGGCTKMAWDKEAGRADHGDGTLADHIGFMIPVNSRSTWDKNTLTSSFLILTEMAIDSHLDPNGQLLLLNLEKLTAQPP